MLRRAVSRPRSSEVPVGVASPPLARKKLVVLLLLILLLLLFLDFLVVFFLFRLGFFPRGALSLVRGARDDDDGVCEPPGGDSSGSARGWGEIADEARAERDGGEERDGVRGGFEGRRGVCRGGGWGIVSRGRWRVGAGASVAAPIDERDARASLSGVEDAAARREDVALLRTLGEDALAELGVRARVRPEEICEGCGGGRGGERGVGASGAARRRRACRDFRWREIVVRSTPAAVRRARRAPSGSPSCSGSCSSNTPRSCTIDVGRLGASGAHDDAIIATGRAGGCCATTPRALLT